jgi:hypothetical protein
LFKMGNKGWSKDLIFSIIISIRFLLLELSSFINSGGSQR